MVVIAIPAMFPGGWSGRCGRVLGVDERFDGGEEMDEEGDDECELIRREEEDEEDQYAHRHDTWSYQRLPGFGNPEKANQLLETSTLERNTNESTALRLAGPR